MRRGLGNGLLLGGSLLVALSLAELAVRALPEAMLGFRFERGRFRLPREFAADPIRNELGFHDVSPAVRRPGARRVLLLGDSYVEGYSVPIPETLGRRLEHYLDGMEAGRYQVVAIGRSGWGQREQLRALRRHGAALRPDLVLTLFLSLNDVEENSDELKQQVREQLSRGELMVRPGWLFESAEAAPFLYARWSALNRLLSQRLAMARARRAAPIPVDYLVYARGDRPRWREAWSRTERLLLETREQAGRLGAGYAIVSASTPQGVWGAQDGLRRLLESYPAMRTLHWDLDLPDRRMAKLCRHHRIPFSALEPRFRTEQRQGGRRLHWRYDGHWNAEGNDFAARLLAGFVRDLDSGARSATAAPP